MAVGAILCTLPEKMRGGEHAELLHELWSSY